MVKLLLILYSNSIFSLPPVKDTTLHMTQQVTVIEKTDLVKATFHILTIIKGLAILIILSACYIICKYRTSYTNM